MKCFNCGNDADLELYMMINGQMKKISICQDCYREQTQNMMDAVQDEFGNIDPEKIQKQMFEFFKNNKEEFNKIIGEAINDEDFDLDDMNLENFEIGNVEFDNSELEEMDETVLEDMFNRIHNKDMEKKQSKDREKYNPFTKFGRDSVTNKQFNDDDPDQRRIRILQLSVDRKRRELMHHLEKEDYMSAASSRDEIREINKKIMWIKRLEKEGEV